MSSCTQVTGPLPLVAADRPACARSHSTVGRPSPAESCLDAAHRLLAAALGEPRVAVRGEPRGALCGPSTATRFLGGSSHRWTLDVDHVQGHDIYDVAALTLRCMRMTATAANASDMAARAATGRAMSDSASA